MNGQAAPLPELYAGDCPEPGCPNPIYRKTLAGVPPKRCEKCRAKRRAKGERPGREFTAGPVESVRAIVRESLTRAGNGEGYREDTPVCCAAAALAAVTGLEEDFAESIISAIDFLLGEGETPLEVRRRLNLARRGGPVVEVVQKPILDVDTWQ